MESTVVYLGKGDKGFLPLSSPMISNFDIAVGLTCSKSSENCSAAAQLQAGSPIPDRSKVMCQTKMDTLVLQVGG
jgi:hypothetical protein